MLFNKIVAVSGLFTLFIFGINVNAYAQSSSDIVITCNESETECDVSPSNTASLFDDSDFPLYDLKPGDEFERTIKVINNRVEECSFSINSFSNIVDSTSELDQTFSERLKTEITDGAISTGVLSFQSLFQSAPVYITSILGSSSSPENIKELIWKVSFDTEAGNEFQNAVLEFDFDWTFSCDDIEQPEETILFIEKTNNKLGIVQSPGDDVTYTITVFTSETPVFGVQVFDLPPGGFSYRSGSWTANSNQRGNLKTLGITTEPTYASPGTWNLGDMNPNEVVTLTYVTDISTDLQSGDYPDIAWTEGVFPEEPSEGQPQERVLGNVSTGYFVGTLASISVPEDVSVKVETDEDEIDVEEEIEVEGNVLGATTLPSTGANIFPMLLGILFVLLGVMFLVFGKRLRVKGTKSLVLFFILSILLCSSSIKVNAQSVTTDPFLSVRVEQPETPGNNQFLNINFVTLNTEGKPVTAICYKKGPLDSSFVAFDSHLSLKPGGDDEFCIADSAVLNKSGTYKFYVTADAGSGVNQTNTVSVQLNYDRPGKPNELEKDENECSYDVKFKTSNDGGITSRVEVYRSTDKEYTANSSNKIKDIIVGSDTKVDFKDTKPNCTKDYFYSVIAFSAAGNMSDPAVETVEVENVTVVEVESESEASASRSDTTAAIVPGGAATIAPEVATGEVEVVIEEPVSIIEEENTEAEVVEDGGLVEGVSDSKIDDAGDVLGGEDIQVNNKYIPYMAGLSIILLIIILFIYASGRKNQVE